eukprot:gene21996-29053_t
MTQHWSGLTIVLAAAVGGCLEALELKEFLTTSQIRSEKNILAPPASAPVRILRFKFLKAGPIRSTRMALEYELRELTHWHGSAREKITETPSRVPIAVLMSTPAPNLFDGHASLALKEEDQKDDVGSKVAGSAPAGEAGEITGEQPAAQTASTAADATAPPAAADATAPPAVANDASAEGVQEVEIPMDINIPAAAANLMARASDTTIQHRAIDAALSALEATSMKKMKAALKSGGTKAFVPKAPKPPPLAEPVEPIVSETIVPMVAAETIAEKIKANVAEGTSQPVDTTARIALRAAMRAYEQTPNPKRIDEAEREADEAVYLAESIYGNIALAQTAADETAADADELTRAVGDNDPPAACTAAKTREITLIEERGAEKMEVARSAIAAADESASKASARAAARKAKSRAAHPAVVSVVKDVIMKVLDQNESKPPPGVRAVENFDSVMAPTIDTPDKGSPDVKASSFVSKIPSIDTATDVDVASPSRSAGSKIPAMVAGAEVALGPDTPPRV